MVTKRARRWFARGTLIAVMTTVVVLGAGTWALSGTIASDLLQRAPRSTETLAVLAVSDGEIVLPRTDHTILPGRWGFETDFGYAELGPIIDVSDTTVVRPVLSVSGTITPGMRGAMDASTFGGDPLARGLVPLEVVVQGPLGDHAAWFVGGTDDTWAIVIHDASSDRGEALRIAGVLARLGFPVLIPTIRNDDGAPAANEGRADLGASEWRDVESAMGYALLSGAEDLVLVGLGTGGSSVILASRESRFSTRVIGVVLDAPLLDAGQVADARLEDLGVPGFIGGWAKALTALRFGVDWSALDHSRLASQHIVPTLLFHGEQDPIYPIEVSRAFARLAPATVLIAVDGAGHGESWNVDPASYEAVLSDFLRRVAIGPSDLPPWG